MMLYTESEITNDFDQLSLLSGGTPKEKITGYSLSLSSKKKENSSDLDHAQTTNRIKKSPTHGNAFGSSSHSFQRLPVTVMGKGRGKIVHAQTENTWESEPHLELEKDLRLAIPHGYRNETIEEHFAHHLKEPQTSKNKSNKPVSLAIGELPIPSNNVALSSLTRIAKKSGKRFPTSDCLDTYEKNFPALK